MLFSTNTGLRSWHTWVFQGGFILKTDHFRELKSYSNTMSVYTGKVNVTIQYGYAALCNWSRTSSKTTRTIAYNRSAMGELFVGGCLILVCSVTKEIKWVSAEEQQRHCSRKTKSNQFAQLPFLNQLILAFIKKKENKKSQFFSSS